ncbi:MAG: L-2-amino-thiazoline-4-carboxylic acid hydrolase [Gammaproteobacteria bacterium]
MEQLPYLERVKIQTEILLPLYKRLREELGRDKANELLRASVHEYASKLGESIGQSPTGSSLDKLRTAIPVFAASDALDVEPVTNNDEELTMNVRGCQYAAYFKALGETEFGAMLTCEIDPPMTKAIGPDLSLDRSKTIMSGGDVCDFRWKLNST